MTVMKDAVVASPGIRLLLSEGDLRQNITVITPKGAKHSLDLWDVISGGFSSVGPKS